MFKDSALQLLLIVDYIFDWARDIYRPSVLRLLKSVASGQAYDQVSLAHDSDIMSLQGQVPDVQERVMQWVSPAPHTVTDIDGEEAIATPTTGVRQNDGTLPVSLPDTGYGLFRSAFTGHKPLRGAFDHRGQCARSRAASRRSQ